MKGLAATQRDTAAQRLATAVRACDEARKKAAMLLQYRGEYESRLANVSGSGIGATALRNYQSFLANLDRAMAQQAEQVVHAERDLNNAKVLWIDLHRRTESFQALDDRHVDAQATIARRLEQKQADEWVTQSHHRRLAPAR
ncbi:MAG: flagellar export protein FliJ [Betaproteobacteria bacterium]